MVRTLVRGDRDIVVRWAEIRSLRKINVSKRIKRLWLQQIHVSMNYPNNNSAMHALVKMYVAVDLIAATYRSFQN